MASLTSFTGRLGRMPDGFVGIEPGDGWRVGGVVLARSEAGFAAVQKAPREGYEFSNLWALPGGMIRVPGGGSGSVDMARAAASRAEAEAGLGPTALHTSDALGPVVTRYTVRGVPCFTLIVPFTCDIDGAPALAPADRSIQAAKWMAVPPDLAQFAPANRLILGHLLWARLRPEDQAAARGSLDAALQACSAWSSDMRLAPPAAPWASNGGLVAWAADWP